MTNKKTAEEETQPTTAYFEDMVEAVLGQMSIVLLATYERRGTGAFAYGSLGLLTVAAETLSQVKTSRDTFNASTYALAAVLQDMGAYTLSKRPTSEEKDTSEPA